MGTRRQGRVMRVGGGGSKQLKIPPGGGFWTGRREVARISWDLFLFYS